MGTVWSFGVTGPDRLYRSAWSWQRTITVTSSSAPAPWPTMIGRSPRSVWTSTCYMPRTDLLVIILAPATGSLKAITNYRMVWPALNASSSGDTLPGIIGATVAMAQVRFSDLTAKCICSVAVWSIDTYHELRENLEIYYLNVWQDLEKNECSQMVTQNQLKVSQSLHMKDDLEHLI